MKLAIVGSRAFSNYGLLEKEVDKFIAENKFVVDLIVSGGAKGPDSYAEIYALRNNIPTKVFIPNWDKLGKSAGYKRNIQIIDNCDAVIAFWDGTSKGTKHSIDIATEKNKIIKVINMTTLKIIEGDLIEMTKNGKFDVIAHGCNCFCTMGGGIARQIREHFPSAWEADEQTIKGDIKKLGNFTAAKHENCYILNCYTQFHYGSNHIDGSEKPLDYEALTLCMKKINFIFKGKSIGLPKIGAGLAGGDWNKIEEIIKKELKDLNVTIVCLK